MRGRERVNGEERRISGVSAPAWESRPRMRVPSYLFIESGGDCQEVAGVSGTGHAAVGPAQVMEPATARCDGTAGMTGRDHVEVGSAGACHERTTGTAGSTGRGHAGDRPWSNDWRPVPGVEPLPSRTGKPGRIRPCGGLPNGANLVNRAQAEQDVRVGRPSRT